MLASLTARYARRKTPQGPARRVRDRGHVRGPPRAASPGGYSIPGCSWTSSACRRRPQRGGCTARRPTPQRRHPRGRRLALDQQVTGLGIEAPLADERRVPVRQAVQFRQRRAAGIVDDLIGQGRLDVEPGALEGDRRLDLSQRADVGRARRRDPYRDQRLRRRRVGQLPGRVGEREPLAAVRRREAADPRRNLIRLWRFLVRTRAAGV